MCQHLKFSPDAKCQINPLLFPLGRFCRRDLPLVCLYASAQEAAMRRCETTRAPRSIDHREPPQYFAASFRTVVALRIVAGMPTVFSKSPPASADSLKPFRRSQ